jgi:hypothetical protein
VAVEKVRFSQNRRDFGDRKCLPEARASLVGLPNAKFFEHFSGNEFFNSHEMKQQWGLSTPFGWRLTSLKMTVN